MLGRIRRLSRGDRAHTIRHTLAQGKELGGRGAVRETQISCKQGTESNENTQFLKHSTHEIDLNNTSIWQNLCSRQFSPFEYSIQLSGNCGGCWMGLQAPGLLFVWNDLKQCGVEISGKAKKD